MCRWRPVWTNWSEQIFCFHVVESSFEDILHRQMKRVLYVNNKQSEGYWLAELFRTAYFRKYLRRALNFHMKEHAIKIYFVLLIHITRSESIVNFKLFSVAGVYSEINYEYACCFLHDWLQSIVYEGQNTL